MSGGGAAPGRDPRAADAAERLLAWYGGRERDVPWRGEESPYRIWVAEVMAQQTRMETVRDYYPAFLERFPDVGTLAEADGEDVLKAWEGLGYYGRARRLHRAAREVVERYGGRLPDDVDRLLRLPGIGPYTAGAVASLAFGKPEPAVDGNARRVLCRLFDLEEPTASDLERAARELLAIRPERAADLNQALMDLGGAVCTPRSPSCGGCPVAELCLARRRGTIERRPPPRSRGELPHRRVAVGLVWEEGRLLMARRPPEGLLGGLWEFPGGKIEEGEEPAAAVRRELREEMDVEVEVGEALEPVRHAYSHFRVTLRPFHARIVAGTPTARSAVAWRWIEPEAIEEVPLPAANHRILAQLRASREAPGAGSAPPQWSP